MNEITYTGNGETKTFYFTFAYFDASDVKISIDGIAVADGEYAIQKSSAGSSADIPYDGGEITFFSAPAQGVVIKIWREIELERSIDYQPTALIKAESLNQDFNFSLEALKDFQQKLMNISDQYADLLTLPGATELFETINTLLAQIEDFGDLDTIVRNETTDAIQASVSALAEQLAALPDMDTKADVVDVRRLIETYQDGTEWYKIFEETQSDGTVKYWCEQGGLYTGGATTINLLVEMTADSYNSSISRQTAPSYWATTYLCIQSKTTTSVVVAKYGDSASGTINWIVSGYCNEPTTGE